MLTNRSLTKKRRVMVMNTIVSVETLVNSFI